VFEKGVGDTKRKWRAFLQAYSRSPVGWRRGSSIIGALRRGGSHPDARPSLKKDKVHKVANLSTNPKKLLKSRPQYHRLELELETM
jgi:hypothetical protein